MPPQQPKINLDDLPDQVDLSALPDQDIIPTAATNQEQPGMLGKTWNFLTTSPFVSEPTMEERMNPVTARSAAWRSGVAGMTSPLAIGGELLGGIGALKGVSRLRNVFGKGAQAASEIAPETKAADIVGSQVINEVPKIKPRVRVNTDGTFTNLDTGEILNPKVGKELTPPQTIKPMFNPRGQTGMTGSTQPPMKPPTNNEIPKLLEGSNEPAKFATEAQKDSIFSQVRNFQRTLLTSFDFSAPGRQGKGLITHPEYWRAFDDMFKSWGSKRASQVVNESIINHPSGLFKPNTKGISKAQEAGLDLTDIVTNKEEAFRSRIAEKWIPGVERSDRAYVAFLNKARSDVFAKLVKQAGAENNLPVMRDIANSINVSTGRGRLGVEDSARAMRVLNETFFAPKLMSSRVQMYTRVFNPKLYSEMDPVIRKEAWRSLLGTVGTGLLIGEMAKLGGAQITNDPTSSDFRKIQIGNTRIDPFAGLQQYGVAAAKLLTGTSTSSVSGRSSDLTSGRFGAQNRADVVTNFLTNKLAPIPSFIWAWMNNKEFDGEPFDAKAALVQRTVPIVLQDLNDLYQEDPNLLPLGIFPMMGEGIQTYGR